jgi:mannose-1-phosphate guanylyltransferase/mannose-6-phosphate isomerase
LARSEQADTFWTVKSPRLVPVLLSGGAGTRLWPASRSSRPKQFLRLVDDRTMLGATLDRLDGLEIESPLVVGNVGHSSLVAAELASAGHDPERMILEPFGRNTAPAAAVAALELTRGGDDPVMLLLPADHVIDDVAAFHAAVNHAAALAADGGLVTFGIVPTSPETGYGYIRTGPPVDRAAFTVARFVEKPKLETARAYLSGGDYLWNSGMFVFRCSKYLAALAEHAPRISMGCAETMKLARRDSGIYLDAESFGNTPADSIDYAVMEHTAEAIVVPLAAGWNDVGSWTALWDIGQKDEDGNVTHGDVITVATAESYVRSDHRLVAVAGVENIVVVETADAVLVTSLENAQLVKNIVESLQRRSRQEATGRAE